MKTRWITYGALALCSIVVLAGCDIRFIAGPSVVKHGEQVQYQIYMAPPGGSTSNATVHLTGDIPAGWSIQTASFLTSASGGQSGPCTVHPSDPGVITGLPPVPPGHQRIYLSAGPLATMTEDDAGTALVDFVGTSQQGSYTMTFWGGVSSEPDHGESFSIPVSVMAPTAPSTILADGLEFGTLAGWSSWLGLDGRTVAYYPMNGDATDHSFYGNDGTAVGDPIATEDRWGNPGGALLFDGTEDQILVSDAPSLDLEAEMTLAAWVRPAAGGGPWVVGKRDLSFGGFLYTLDIQGGVVRGVFRDSGGAIDFATGFHPIALDQWQLLVLTFDGDYMVSYLDGILQGQRERLGALIGTGAGGIEIGSFEEARFGGGMDDVLIMNRALSFREIMKLMQ